MKNTTAMTDKFLKQIAHHLSGKPNCKSIEYKVIIQDNYVECYPSISVFPDRYHRQLSDKTSVLYHVVAYHFPQLYRIDDPHDSLPTLSRFKIVSDILTEGTYLYRFAYNSSGNKTKRYWIKQDR